MQKCIKCNSVDGVIRSGFLRGKQRFFCKLCNFHFILENENAKLPQKANQATIVDLAKHLGIAASTVSRALNGKADISPFTRQAVMQAAIDLDYRPNLLAQSLNKGKTNTIGVVIPNVELPFFATALASMQQVAIDTGYRIMVCHSSESQSVEKLNIETLIACRVDGLLVSHSKETTSFEHIEHVLAKSIPIVHFDRVCNEIDTPKVIHEDFKGSFDLVEHLIVQGCQKIGVMLGPEKFYISQIRLEGYKAALQKYGIEVDEKYIYYSEMNKNDGSKAFEYFINMQQPPDGVFAMLSRNAIEMMVEAKKRQVKIPEEMAFVGFGDDILCELFEPSLTVFNHFPNKVGEAAINLLIENINSKNTPNTTTQSVRGELIVRASSINIFVKH
ncbi:LacI family DNA-binding transcriptional regulator [Emticicia sp. C21]|uniref:LacI family DNA-binding transcriptional regulator n=1 Tax=Emticicia sp. C21 TaxID=2302915 RepID=UPI000E3417BF|nr:substrate-binding domain-containing protein [Emticicia sp. C21]RFS18118.1 LacI family DNA-binding transcriptional regulator [Emticicia sp. C21]